MENINLKRHFNKKNLLPTKTYYEVPAEAFLIKQEGNPPFKIPPQCIISISIGAPFLTANKTKVKIPVFYDTVPGTPGILKVYFKILTKFYIFRHIIPSTPPLRHPLILAESEDQTWQVSSFKKTTRNADGEEVEETVFASEARNIVNCPPREPLVFTYPVDVIMDKYVKFKAWATCCKHNDKVIVPTETYEGFMFRSNS